MTTTAPTVLAVGTTYRDLVMSGMDRLPELGQELRARTFVPTWGGVANVARIAASLGCPCRLCSPMGRDATSRAARGELADWGVDVSASPILDDWDLPVTISLAVGTERAMATVETPAPPLDRPDLDGVDVIATHLHLPAPQWLLDAADKGITVIADHGFEETPRPDLLDALSRCTVFTPNAAEAAVLTGLDDPMAAARRLAESIPVVLVTCGADGIVGVDSRRGEEARVPGVRVRPLNTTGAGDATVAGYARTLGADLPLARRLDVAALVGAVVTSRPRGTADPLTMDDLVAVGDPGRFGFLRDLL